LARARGVALALQCSRTFDPSANRRRRFAGRARDDPIERNARDLEVQVDSVQQRTRELRNVARNRCVVAPIVAGPSSSESTRTGSRCCFATRLTSSQGGEVAGNRLSNCLLERPDASTVVMMRSALELAATELQSTSTGPSGSQGGGKHVPHLQCDR
jgi:hypothetical protein